MWKILFTHTECIELCLFKFKLQPPVQDAEEDDDIFSDNDLILIIQFMPLQYVWYCIHTHTLRSSGRNILVHPGNIFSHQEEILNFIT